MALIVRTDRELECPGLDAALRAYVDSYGASALEVRVRRGSQWVDLTYTFVP